ncbi:MAG: DUF3822 family protein [Sphingobacteriaceae bacterium]|nr:DUF3822 family protein [Sphingobacteriaceae bacterium]
MKHIDIHTAAGKNNPQQADTLAIVLTNGGYSFCTSNAKPPFQISRLISHPTPAHWEHLSPVEQFDWLKMQHSELQGKFRRITIAYDSPRCTLVPAAIYRDGTGTDYFELVYGGVQNEQLHRDSLNALELEVISAFPIGWLGATAVQFHEPRVTTVAASMCQRLARHNSASKSNRLYLHLQANSLSCWQYSGTGLLAHNRFFIATTEDILYYAHLLVKQDAHELYYFGDSDLCQKALPQLLSYFNQVEVLPSENLIAFDAQLTTLDPADLQLLYACLCAS